MVHNIKDLARLTQDDSATKSYLFPCFLRMYRLLNHLGLHLKQIEFIVIGEREDENQRRETIDALQRFFVHQLIAFLISDFIVKCGLSLFQISSLLTKLCSRMTEYIAKYIILFFKHSPYYFILGNKS